MSGYVTTIRHFRHIHHPLLDIHPPGHVTTIRHLWHIHRPLLYIHAPGRFSYVLSPQTAYRAPLLCLVNDIQHLLHFRVLHRFMAGHKLPLVHNARRFAPVTHGRITARSPSIDHCLQTLEQGCNGSQLSQICQTRRRAYSAQRKQGRFHFCSYQHLLNGIDNHLQQRLEHILHPVDVTVDGIHKSLSDSLPNFHGQVLDGNAGLPHRLFQPFHLVICGRHHLVATLDHILHILLPQSILVPHEFLIQLRNSIVILLPVHIAQGEILLQDSLLLPQFRLQLHRLLFIPFIQSQILRRIFNARQSLASLYRKIPDAVLQFRHFLRLQTGNLQHLLDAFNLQRLHFAVVGLSVLHTPGIILLQQRLTTLIFRIDGLCFLLDALCFLFILFILVIAVRTPLLGSLSLFRRIPRP